MVSSDHGAIFPRTLHVYQHGCLISVLKQNQTLNLGTRPKKAQTTTRLQPLCPDDHSDTFPQFLLLYNILDPCFSHALKTGGEK